MKTKADPTGSPHQLYSGFPGGTRQGQGGVPTPNQFFDEILPNANPSVNKIVAAVIMQMLGQDRHEWLTTYGELMEKAGIRSKGGVAQSLWDALVAGYLIKRDEEDGPGFYLRLRRLDEPACIPDWPRGKQQARPGYVYLLQGGFSVDLYKIGCSIDPQRRILQLESAIGMKLQLLHKIHADDLYDAESQLHRRFAGRRVAGEWFALTPEDIRTIFELRRFRKGRFEGGTS